MRFCIIKSGVLNKNIFYFQKKRMFSDAISENFTTNMKFIEPEDYMPIPVYRMMQNNGHLLNPKQELEIGQNILIKMMKTMIELHIMDKLADILRKQKRITMYMSSIGEEATQVSSAAAIEARDMVFTQYREPGVGLWRGFGIEDMFNQCFGNKDDLNKGRQMPVHYGNANCQFFSISSPLATQMTQAVGYAYVNKLSNNGMCVVCYFGEGSASEGDAHVAFNFAATLRCPVIFFCRNNGYAISTPIAEQYSGDGIAARGHGYGITSIRVDGNDPLAVYMVSKAARKMCVEENKPIIIEAMTYRISDHVSSDQSISYQSLDDISFNEINNNPILKMKIFLISKGWWSEEEELEYKRVTRQRIVEYIERAETKAKGNPMQIFTDVYDSLHPRLIRQMKKYQEFISNHKEHYPDNFEDPSNM